LLGNGCYIGLDGNPAVLNPQLTLNSAQIINDPDPAAHPDTAVIVANATAADTTLAGPVVKHRISVRQLRSMFGLK
jgi:hypothetical protein